MKIQFHFLNNIEVAKNVNDAAYVCRYAKMSHLLDYFTIYTLMLQNWNSNTIFYNENVSFKEFILIMLNQFILIMFNQFTLIMFNQFILIIFNQFCKTLSISKIVLNLNCYHQRILEYLVRI
jgi:hypothetical protein